MIKKQDIFLALNLGCGQDYRPGWLNIDFNKNVKADLYLDFKKKLCFKKNSVDYIFCSHVLEHLVYPEKFLQELERIIKPGTGILELTLPHYNFFAHHRDLTHRFFCTSQTFCEFVQKTNYQTNFKIMKINYVAPFKKIVSKFLSLSQLEFFGYPIYDVTWFLKKI